MKDSRKIQLKLSNILRGRADIHVPTPYPWSELQFKEIAWIIHDFVSQNGDVTNEDPLHEWLEEYQFFLNQGGG